MRDRPDVVLHLEDRTQLIVGPDAATCAVIAAVVTPLAAGDPTRQWQLVMTMTAMTGFWCLIASRFKLGVLADFLSRPILMGLLNGVAITIMVGQLSKIFGFTFSERYLIERILNGTDYLTQTHLPTLAMSLTALLTLLLAKRYKTSVTVLVEVNGLRDQNIRIGQVLTIPQS